MLRFVTCAQLPCQQGEGQNSLQVADVSCLTGAHLADYQIFIMGHGASTVKDVLKPLLLSQELIDGSARLADDNIFRQSFTNYIKGGSWLDRLAQLVPDSHFIANGLVRREKDHVVRLREYNIDNERMLSIESSGKSDKSPGIPTSPTLNSTSSSRSFVNDAHSDMYQNSESSCFNQEDLLTILFTILYPIYLSSHEYERFVKYGIERGEGAHADEDSSGPARVFGGHLDTRMVQTNQSKRAQELLLGCAAYFDESLLLEHLQDAAWLHGVCGIFHDYPMAVCIVDTTKTGLPMVYVNKAFCQLTGYPEAELLGANLSILNGPQTEVSQLKLMHNSVRSTETVKFSISLQTKQKRPLFDLMAQKAVGSYSISAHFVKSKASQLSSLNVVDDLLIMLSYLVKAPALPKPSNVPSWLPSQISILAHASSALMSPSSARSASSNGSRNGHGGGGRKNNSAQNSIRSGSSAGFVPGHITSGSGSNHSSAQNSYRSFRVGGGSNGTRGSSTSGTSGRRHSKGDPTTPSSSRSTGANASSATTSVGRHVQVDDTAVMEFSMGETTHDNSPRT